MFLSWLKDLNFKIILIVEEFLVNFFLLFHNSAYINSIASSLVDYPMVLSFKGEVVIEDDIQYPPNTVFYEDQKNKGVLNDIMSLDFRKDI
jgi:hypothetical protein